MASGKQHTRSGTKSSETFSRSGSEQPVRQCGRPLSTVKDHLYCTRPYRHEGKCSFDPCLPDTPSEPYSFAKEAQRHIASKAADARFHMWHWWDGPPRDWANQHDRAIEYAINHGAQ